MQIYRYAYRLASIREPNDLHILNLVIAISYIPPKLCFLLIEFKNFAKFAYANFRFKYILISGNF